MLELSPHGDVNEILRTDKVDNVLHHSQNYVISETFIFRTRSRSMKRLTEQACTQCTECGRTIFKASAFWMHVKSEIGFLVTFPLLTANLASVLKTCLHTHQDSWRNEYPHAEWGHYYFKFNESSLTASSASLIGEGDSIRYHRGF